MNYFYVSNGKLFLHIACYHVRITQQFGRIESSTRTKRTKGIEIHRYSVKIQSLFSTLVTPISSFISKMVER